MTGYNSGTVAWSPELACCVSAGQSGETKSGDCVGWGWRSASYKDPSHSIGDGDPFPTRIHLTPVAGPVRPVARSESALEGVRGPG